MDKDSCQDFDKFTNDFIDYLNNENVGALLIDDLWGVGKTFTVKQIVSSEKYKDNIKKIKYYSILNINNFNNDINLKEYTLNNLKKINTTNYINIHIKNLFDFDLEMSEKNRDRFALSGSWIKSAISFKLKKEKNPDWTKEIQDKPEKMNSYLCKHAVLNNEIVLIIDEIERKKNNLELKDLFLKIIDFQENNKIKIILIMNSKELNEADKKILEKWSEKVISKKINLSSRSLFNGDGVENIFELISFNNIDSFLKKESKNIRILRMAELFIKDVESIIKNTVSENAYNNSSETIELIRIMLLQNVLMYLNNKKSSLNNIELYEAIDAYYNSNKCLIIKFIKSKFNLYLKEDFDFHYELLEEKNITAIDKLRVVEIYMMIDNYYESFSDYLKCLSNVEESYLKIQNNTIYNIKKISLLNQSYEKDIFELCNKKIIDLLEINENCNINENHFSIINWLSFCFSIIKEKYAYTLEYIDNNLSDISSMKMNFKYYFIIYILKIAEKEICLLNSNLGLLRNDLFVKKMKNDILKEYNNFKKIINENHILNYTLYDNIKIVEYNFKNNFDKIDLLKELLKNKDNPFKEISIEEGILRLTQIDEKIIEKIESLLENESSNDVDFSNIKIAIEKIKKDRENKIIQYINYNENKKETELESLIEEYESKIEMIKKSHYRFLNTLEYGVSRNITIFEAFNNILFNDSYKTKLLNLESQN